MSRNLLKKNPYKFDKMGYTTPRLGDKAVMDAVRLVTRQTPVITKVVPLGIPFLCHQNAAMFAEELGGKPVRGYRVDLSVRGILEMIDHSVVQVGDEFIDVTPYYEIKSSMFVGSDRDMPEIKATYTHPMLPHYGTVHTCTRPCFNIPMTMEGQKLLLIPGKIPLSTVVEASRLREEGAVNSANIIVVRFGGAA